MPMSASPAAAGGSRWIRSVPCSTRCTGRPRPIPGDGSTRCGTRSSAGTSCGGRGSRCAQQRRAGHRQDHPGRGRGVRGGPAAGRVGRRIEGGAVSAVAGASGVHPEAGRRGRERPLSIPAVRDRIVQAAVKIVLEPVFEADMLPCSFGFRPKRGAHDALQVLVDESWRGRRWVVETDIANCFSAIPHDQLMQAVEERVCDQSVLKLLRAMLRAGVMEDGLVRRAVTGTPQGGVIFRCCATSTCTGSTGRGMCASTGCWCAIADDAVVMCTSRQQAEAALGAVAGAAGRARVGAEGGQDPDRAAAGRWGGVRFPRLPPPAGRGRPGRAERGASRSSPAGPRTGPCSTPVTGSGN